MKPPMPNLRYLILGLATAFVPQEVFASSDLARSRNCVACHHADRRMVGPSYAAIAARYADDVAAPATLSERIIAGTQGNWGRMPMPAQPNLSPADAEALARWILSRP